MKPVPVVFIHKSEQDYVLHALRSAGALNPEVVMITDTVSCAYAQWASTVSIDELGHEASARLKEIYRHMSTNGFEFELTCIERWFILLEYMNRNGVDKLVYLDSDVMSYTGYAAIIEQHYADRDLCLCIPQQQHEQLQWSASGHISVWTQRALSEFCTFILHIYSNETETLQEKWQWHVSGNIPGGICDMTLLYLFQRSTSLQVGNLLHINAAQACFDNSIKSGNNEMPGEFETEFNWLTNNSNKRIRFQHNIPYGFVPVTNAPVRFYALHFQGDAKKLMPIFQRAPQSLADRYKQVKWIARLVYGRFRNYLS